MSEAPAPQRPGFFEKWCSKTWMIVVAFLCVGPLALPLVWMNPRYGLAKKILGTILMLGGTWLMVLWMKDSFDRIMAQYRELKSAMGMP